MIVFFYFLYVLFIYQMEPDIAFLIATYKIILTTYFKKLSNITKYLIKLFFFITILPHIYKQTNFFDFFMILKV